MIEFYYWPTPNGWKVSIMLEETGLPYTLCPLNIGAGDLFKPEFLKISPNARMPAIVDQDTPDGLLPIFESGPILIHLAEKSGRFLPTSARGRKVGQALDEFSNVSRWRDAVTVWPAMQKGVDVGKDLRRRGDHAEESRKILFGQTAKSLSGTA